MGEFLPLCMHILLTVWYVVMLINRILNCPRYDKNVDLKQHHHFSSDSFYLSINLEFFFLIPMFLNLGCPATPPSVFGVKSSLANVSFNTSFPTIQSEGPDSVCKSCWPQCWASWMLVNKDSQAHSLIQQTFAVHFPECQEVCWGWLPTNSKYRKTLLIWNKLEGNLAWLIEKSPTGRIAGR